MHRVRPRGGLERYTRRMEQRGVGDLDITKYQSSPPPLQLMAVRLVQSVHSPQLSDRGSDSLRLPCIVSFGHQMSDRYGSVSGIRTCICASLWILSINCAYVITVWMRSEDDDTNHDANPH
jgi:hypothetical protein